MKKRPIKSNLTRLDATKDEDIDYSEIPELGAEFFSKAKLLRNTPRVTKVAISARLDEDVLSWLKKTGPGYLSRMNAILRAAMESEPKKTKPTKAKRRAG